MTQYSDAMHIPLMALTMIIRCLSECCPELRRSGLKDMFINGREAHQSILFRFVDPDKKRAMTMKFIRTLVETLSAMHVHNLSADKDFIHRRMHAAVTRQSSVDKKLQLLSFILTFGFSLNFPKVTPAVLETMFGMNSYALACKFWQLRIVCVTPRYGQGRQKSWHSNLLGYLRSGDKQAFVDLIQRIHDSLVLSLPKCKVLASIMIVPQDHSFNRMEPLLGIFREIKGYGHLETKNLIEGAIAHNLFKPTAKEIAKLPNGEGSNKFFQALGISRADVTYKLTKRVKKVKSIEVQTHDLEWHSYNLEGIGFSTSLLDEVSTQFWSCCQGRILKVQEFRLNEVANAIPYHLWRTKRILKHIADSLD